MENKNTISISKTSLKLLIYLYKIYLQSSKELHDLAFSYNSLNADVKFETNNEKIYDDLLTICGNNNSIIIAFKYLTEKGLINYKKVSVLSGDVDYINLEITPMAIDIIEEDKQKKEMKQINAIFNLDLDISLESLIKLSAIDLAKLLTKIF